MDQKRQVIIIVAVAILLSSLSLTFAKEAMASFTQAPYVPSACFDGVDKGKFLAGFGNSQWKKEICGQKLKVTCIDENSLSCKSSSVTVTLADRCEDCDQDSITLSEEAFEAIANKDAGRVKVEYEQVSV